MFKKQAELFQHLYWYNAEHISGNHVSQYWVIKGNTAHFKVSLIPLALWCLTVMFEFVNMSKQPEIWGSYDSSLHKMHPGAVSLTVM